MKTNDELMEYIAAEMYTSIYNYINKAAYSEKHVEKILHLVLKEIFETGDSILALGRVEREYEILRIVKSNLEGYAIKYNLIQDCRKDGCYERTTR